VSVTGGLFSTARVFFGSKKAAAIPPRAEKNPARNFRRGCLPENRVSSMDRPPRNQRTLLIITLADADQRGAGALLVSMIFTQLYFDGIALAQIL
jgi:hypothetical protein